MRGENMECPDIKALHELLDRALEPQAVVGVERHLRACASCLARYQGLEAVARAVAALPSLSPSPAFRGRVLAALAAARPSPRRLEWGLGALGALVSGWTAAAVFLAASRLGPDRFLRFWELLADPARTSAILKAHLAKAILVPGHLLAALRFTESLLGPEAAYLPLQAAAAAGIALIFMTMVASRAPLGAATRNWRTI
ncbi:MAG: hypothetical protein PHF00_02445 [Elusimicrobia bacterium]|nr:hypothetical protein [Elusimicrobiota bacterium]